MSPHPARFPLVVRASRVLALAGVLAALTGCGLLGKKDKPPQYDPIGASPTAAATAGPTAGWQLVLAPVQVARPYDSLRIAVRPAPQELQVYKDGTWAQRPAEMLERALLRTLEDSGRLPAVARAGSGIVGDYRLLLDIRRFEADYAGAAVPSATIEVSAKLLHSKSADVVASRVFVQAEPAAGTAVPAVVDAFDRALARVSRDVADWTVASGGSGRGR
ncbi:ABC-type transport auxiliary lipoprotein family protein [Lysobacter humi (ex Lee et al. 2017)]